MVVAIISVLSIITIVLLQPGQIFKDAQTLKIESDKKDIVAAYIEYKLLNNGQTPFEQALKNGVIYKICREEILDCNISNFEVTLNTLKEENLLYEIPINPLNNDSKYTGYLISDFDGVDVDIIAEGEIEYPPENTPPGECFQFDNNSYCVVIGRAGELWLDRNLGAVNTPENLSDGTGFGDLYQFGRGSDGHEIRTSAIMIGPSSSLLPGTDFLSKTKRPYNWFSGSDKDNVWQGTTGTNNPCPNTWRLPSEIELNAEIISWESQNAAGAFGSPLKLILGGKRDNLGTLVETGSTGYYWSYSLNTGADSAKALRIDSTSASVNDKNRVEGISVRCIKDKSALINPGSSSNFTLPKDKQGMCKGKIDVKGTYKVAIPLTSKETIKVSVLVASTGTYSISTNLINGYSFSKSGIFNKTGNTTVILNNNGGTPISARNDTLTVSSEYGSCKVKIKVID